MKCNSAIVYLKVGCASLLLAMFAGAQQGGRSSSLEKFTLNQFRREIGYSDLPVGVDPGEGVRFDWPPVTSLLAVDAAWKPVYDASHATNDAGVRKIDLHRGSEELSLEIFVACTGPAGARAHLLDSASATMMSQIPYRRGPEGLGDLSIISRENDPGSIIWTLRNVCFHLRKTDSQLTLAPLAAALDLLARGHIVPRIADHLPKPANVVVSPPRVSEGAGVTVELKMPPEADLGRLEADFVQTGQHLAVRARRGLTIEFTGRQQGTAELQFRVLDKRNLLVASVPLRIEVTPR